jgi:hypothetical protein
MRVKPAYFGCFGLVLLPILPFIVVTQLNNWRLNQLESEFAALSHPPNSKYVARFNDIGNFGNGNHLDFLVTELRVKTGDGQIGEFYKGKTVPIPNAADDDFQRVKDGRQPLDIIFLPSPLPANYEIKHGYAKPWNLNFAAGQKNLYVVGVWNTGESNSFGSMFDLRGS